MKNLDDKLLDEFDVAILCCVPVTTVREWRRLGIGPRYQRTFGYAIQDLGFYLSGNSLLDDRDLGNVEEVMNT
jgi:hypothetical protein